MLSNYVKNGLDISINPPKQVPILQSNNTLCLIGTAPQAQLEPHHPHPISAFDDLKKLGPEGSLYTTLSYAFSHARFECFVIVVPAQENEAKTLAAVVGKPEDKTGVYASLKMASKPTLMAAPFYSHHENVRKALDTIAERLYCRYLSETTDENEAKSKKDAESRHSDREYLVDNGGFYSMSGAEVYLSPAAAALPALMLTKPWKSPEGFALKLSRLKREIEYSPAAPARTTESDRLNSLGVSNIVRGLSKPFILKGNRATSGRFISQTGILDHVLHLANLAMEDTYGENLTQAFIESVINTLNSSLSALIFQDALAEIKVSLDEERNNRAALEAGSWFLTIQYDHFSVNENPHLVLKPGVAALVGG